MAKRQTLRLVQDREPSQVGGEGQQRLSPEVFSDVGAMLADARRRHGLELRQVVETLRIRLAYLTAIEEGRTADLPGATYAVGFVRAYADYLGLDGNDVVRLFKRQAAGLDSRTELSFPTPVPESGFPGRGLILAGLLLAGLVWAGWYAFGGADSDLGRFVGEVPADLQAWVDGMDGEKIAGETRAPTELPQPRAPEAAAVEAEAPVETALSVAGPVPAPATQDSAPVEAAPAPSALDAVAAPLPQPEPPPLTATVGTSRGEAETASLMEPAAVVLPEAGETAAPPPAAAAELPPGNAAVPESAAEEAARVYGVVDAPVRVVLRAVGDSWIQVRDRTNDVRIMRILKAGEAYRVPEEDGLVLRVGDAGNLEIEVDGRNLGLLGAPGEVMKNVPLDAGSLAVRAGG